MGKLFGNMTTEGLEETEDRLGGGRQLLDTKVFENGTCKLAFVGKSDGGANFMRVLFDLEGNEYEETIYFTNKKGENFYVDKQDGKKQQMPGFVTVNELCLTATGKELSDQDFEERQIEVWDNDAKAKVRQAREVAVDLINVPITVAIRKFIENKSVKTEVDGKTVYTDSDETREGNEIVKFFHPETRATVAEIKKSQKDGAGPLEAKFIDDWSAKYPTDYVADKRTKKGGAKGSGSGAPPKASADGAKPKTSLFAK
jgi:hypothetical protein